MKPSVAVAILALVLFAGCAAPHGALHVTGIPEARQGISGAQASSTAASLEIAGIKTTASRVEAKDDIITQWESRQERRRHESP